MTRSIDPVAAPHARMATPVIRAWLMLLGLMVYAMILIGGATRLTDSGLSITEWDVVSGTLPPLGAEAWQAEFDKYRQTAEYRFQNRGMTLAEFQVIYWWEWGHRLFGRLIGLVAVGGLAWFAARRWLTGRLALRLGALVALGGLQGAIGWWMVASGLGETERIDVAPYRLMTHFTLALVIIGMIAWLWMDLGGRRRTRAGAAAWLAGIGLLGLVTLQMAAGALVAGLDAGRSYTDWPLMAGELVPGVYLAPELGWRSLFEGREATQFNHRLLAYVLLATSLWAAFAFRQGGHGFGLLAGLVTAQSAWGILTLVNAAPLELALVHQGLGVLVFLAALRTAWRVQSQEGEVRSLVSTNTARQSPGSISPATMTSPPG